MGRIFRASALGRPLDFSFATNVAITALAAALAAGLFLWRLLAGALLLPSLLAGLGAGVTVFLAWAIGRELDPDVPASALAGAGLALPGLFFLGRPVLLAVLWLLMAARLLNRTAGPKPTALDSVAVLGLGSWLVLTNSWIYGAAAGAAFLLDGLLDPPNRRQLAFAVPALAGAALAVLYGETIVMAGPPGSAVALATVGITLLYSWVIASYGRVQSVADQTGLPLRPARVRSAQILVLAGTVALAGWWGLSGIEELMPVWAALAGAGLVHPFRRRGPPP